MTPYRTTDVGYGEEYWATLDGGNGYTDSTLWEDIAHALKEVFGIRDGRDVSGSIQVVDVGCAMGYLVKHLRRRGFDAWGLDFSVYALEHADPAAASYLRWFDLTWVDDSHFGRQAFDLAVCFETLEHIPAERAEQALRHLWKLLKPGGTAVLTICVEGQPDSESDPTHVNVVPRSWWEGKLEVEGWQRLPDIEARLRTFWLFSLHRGVFAVRRPV